VTPPRVEAPGAGGQHAGAEENNIEQTPHGAASFCSSSTPLYDRMCAAISCCHSTLEADLDALSREDQLQVCLRIIRSTYELERKITEVRLRAERGFNVLLRDVAGLPPKRKRDATWLRNFE